jgi:hypothetical protein
MNQDVYLIVNGEDIHVGRVEDVLNPQCRMLSLRSAIRDIVEDLVFSNDSPDYVVCSIEVR